MIASWKHLVDKVIPIERQQKVASSPNLMQRMLEIHARRHFLNVCGNDPNCQTLSALAFGVNTT